MKKVPGAKGMGLISVILLGLAGLISGCFSSSPPEDFLKSPLAYVYMNGAETQFDGVTVEDLVVYGISSQAQKSWKHVEDGTWSLLISLKDNVTGDTTEVNFVLVRHNSPTRVILQRIIVNGTEASSVARDQLANNFGYGALKGKKNAGQP